MDADEYLHAKNHTPSRPSSKPPMGVRARRISNGPDAVGSTLQGKGADDHNHYHITSPDARDWAHLAAKGTCE